MRAVLAFACIACWSLAARATPQNPPLTPGAVLLPAAGTQVDDAAITASVKAKLAADGDINPFNIDVDTNEGVVTLQGRVDKEEARTKAEQLARETDGVKRVINLVKVGDRS